MLDPAMSGFGKVMQARRSEVRNGKKDESRTTGCQSQSQSSQSGAWNVAVFCSHGKTSAASWILLTGLYPKTYRVGVAKGEAGRRRTGSTGANASSAKANAICRDQSSNLTLPTGMMHRSSHERHRTSLLRSLRIATVGLVLGIVLVVCRA